MDNYFKRYFNFPERAANQYTLSSRIYEGGKLAYGRDLIGNGGKKRLFEGKRKGDM